MKTLDMIHHFFQFCKPYEPRVSRSHGESWALLVLRPERHRGLPPESGCRALLQAPGVGLASPSRHRSSRVARCRPEFSDCFWKASRPCPERPLPESLADGVQCHPHPRSPVQGRQEVASTLPRAVRLPRSSPER